MTRSHMGETDQIQLLGSNNPVGREQVATRDNQRKLEAWVDRDLFDALTDWCAANSVGSKTAWLEAAIRTTLNTAQEDPPPAAYVEMISDAREIHARKTSGRRGGQE